MIAVPYRHEVLAIILVLYFLGCFPRRQNTDVLFVNGVTPTETKAAFQHGCLQFASTLRRQRLSNCHQRSPATTMIGMSDPATTSDNVIIPEDIMKAVQKVAIGLWKGVENIPYQKTDIEQVNTVASSISNTSYESVGKKSHDIISTWIEGEANWDNECNDRPFHNRIDIFHERALQGCPHAQHSYGLLMWNGFSGASTIANSDRTTSTTVCHKFNTRAPPLRCEVVSAQYHAAAAYQGHLDGMAVLGGCLRTGTGVSKNVGLGLKLIEFCATQGNPTGVNKQAALLEYNQDEAGAVQLYEACIESQRVNALLLFNLGWCLVNGQGTSKDVEGGQSLWRQAANMAPDEGSEEAAWYLYKEFVRDDPKEASKWLDLAEKLGYHEDF